MTKITDPKSLLVAIECLYPYLATKEEEATLAVTEYNTYVKDVVDFLLSICNHVTLDDFETYNLYLSKYYGCAFYKVEGFYSKDRIGVHFFKELPDFPTHFFKIQKDTFDGDGRLVFSTYYLKNTHLLSRLQDLYNKVELWVYLGEEVILTPEEDELLTILKHYVKGEKY